MDTWFEDPPLNFFNINMHESTRACFYSSINKYEILDSCLQMTHYAFNSISTSATSIFSSWILAALTSSERTDEAGRQDLSSKVHRPRKNSQNQ